MPQHFSDFAILAVFFLCSMGIAVTLLVYFVQVWRGGDDDEKDDSTHRADRAKDINRRFER